MTFDKRLFLKWINLEEGGSAPQVDSRLINLCVLVSQDVAKKVIGFTVFEPRSLDQNFFERLKTRSLRPEFAQAKFKLYLPTFLKHRFETFQRSTPIASLDTKFTSFVHLKCSHNLFAIRDQIRVVNVDDSAVLLKYLKHTFEEFGYADIVAQVSDPRQAVATIERFKPDIVTMDIQMPDKTGVEVVQDLLENNSYPVIMISSLSLEEGSLVIDALNAGAFDYIQKPKLEEKEHFKEELQNKILLALDSESQVKTVRSLPIRKKAVQDSSMNLSNSKNLLWCFGASTGGTTALTEVMRSFPDQIPPTLIVQHIPPIFSKAFAESMNKLCPFTVKEAEDNEPIMPNHVYVAPGGIQMGVEVKLGQLYIALRDEAPVNRFKPSVDYLFNKVAELKNLKIVAALLTGMGKDGAEGLLKLKNAGAYTMAQDQQSSAVYGMPRQAFEIGAALEVVALQDVAQVFLDQSAKVRKAA